MFIGSFEGGEVMRSGCCYERGCGRVFYFQPGHETYATFWNPQVIRILKNAIRWAFPKCRQLVDCIEIPRIGQEK